MKKWLGKIGNAVGSGTTGMAFKNWIDNVKEGNYNQIIGDVRGSIQKLQVNARAARGTTRKYNNNIQDNIAGAIFDLEDSGATFTSNKKLTDALSKKIVNSTGSGTPFEAGKIENLLYTNTRSWPGGKLPPNIKEAESNLTQDATDRKLHFEIGKAYEKALGTIGGMYKDPGNEALDFSEFKGRKLNIPADIRKAINYDAATGYGDAEKGSGHGYPIMASKIINELAEAGKLDTVSGYTAANEYRSFNLFNFKVTSSIIDFIFESLLLIS